MIWPFLTRCAAARFAKAEFGLDLARFKRGTQPRPGHAFAFVLETDQWRMVREVFCSVPHPTGLWFNITASKCGEAP